MPDVAQLWDGANQDSDAFKRALQATQDDDPTPEEMEASLARMRRHQSITFEIELDSWYTVWLTEKVPMLNRIKPELSVIYFKPMLLIATPMMPEFPGRIAVTGAGVANKRCTWITDYGHRTVGFRYCNEDSLKWINLQFARAGGMKFRHRGLVKPDQVIYTPEP